MKFLRSTLFLKLVVISLGIPILVLAIFGFPYIARAVSSVFTTVPYIEVLIFAYMYMAVIPYYLALYQAYRLLTLIDRDEAFSEGAVQSLKTIKMCGFLISVLFMIAMPLIVYMGSVVDIPEVMILGLIIVFASLVIAVFAFILQSLLKNALEIKKENELTV